LRLEAFGLCGFHSPVQLLPAVVSRRRNFEGSADVSNGLALVQVLLSGPQLTDDLLGAVAFDFHGASLGQFWPVGKLSQGLVQFLWSTSLLRLEYLLSKVVLLEHDVTPFAAPVLMRASGLIRPPSIAG